MSEEDIIERIKELIRNCDFGIQDYNDLFMLDKTALEGILELYKQEKEKNKELENELDKTTYLLSRCNKRLEDIARELTAEIKIGYDYTEIMQEIQSLKENECTATKCQMIKESYISKDKIRKFIKEELPEEEICKSCDIYDVNGVSLKEKLEKILEV